MYAPCMASPKRCSGAAAAGVHTSTDKLKALTVDWIFFVCVFVPEAVWFSTLLA